MSRDSPCGEKWAAEQKSSVLTAPSPKGEPLQNIPPDLRDQWHVLQGQATPML